jgi:hypothetical protein
MAIGREADARRLATALLSDLRKYGAASVGAGQDPRTALAGEIAEARELFQGRVAPELHSIFEHELVSFDFARAPRSPGVRRLLLVGIPIVVLAAALTVWVLTRAVE